MILRWLAMMWPEMVAVLLVVFLAGLLTGRALAEEPAYWPPCGDMNQDPRCPDVGVEPEDFRDCTRGGHAVRCDKGLEP